MFDLQRVIAQDSQHHTAAGYLNVASSAKTNYENAQYKVVDEAGEAYKCPHCDKRILFLSKFTEHMRTHTGERPYKCDVCGKGFKQRVHMKSHRVTHF